MLCTSCGITYAQCDKSITLKCSKGRDFKADGSAGQELPIDATITIDQYKIILKATFNGEAETVESDIKEIAFCNWTEYMKAGKTQYKVLSKKGSESTNSIVTVESENGYTKVTFGSDPDTGHRLQFDVAEYTITDAATNNPLNKPLEKNKKTKRKKQKAM